MNAAARISLVPTPIGNLEDITLRALRTLNEVDLIAAEDTRTSGVLLQHHAINTPRVALHQHNEHKFVPQLLDRVERDKLHLAVITDAGTPGISDPGFLLVREAIGRDLLVETLPGPTAFVPALVSSGLPCDRFVFEGFLPHKKGRKTRIETLGALDRTLVFYESPNRLARLLRELGEYLDPSRQACVSREISKMYETHHRGTIAELQAYFAEHPPKGEVVVVVGG